MQITVVIVLNIRNINTGLEFPILSAMIPDTVAHKDWNRKVTENTVENSTRDNPFCIMKTERNKPGTLPAVKIKKLNIIMLFKL